jgi:uncharacterized protein YifE (UPF0438 family)
VPAITAATITAFYLFDVADEIDLPRLQQEIGGGAAAARFAQKSGTPTYLQYAIPPLIVDGDAVGIAEIQGFRARLKFFDYGVVSLALTRPFAGDWSELIALSQRYIDNEALEQQAEGACRSVVARVAAAMTRGRSTWLSEDYLVFAVTELDSRMAAEELLSHHGEEMALLLRGEKQALSRQEQESVLRNRMSYLASDLVVPTWNAAFVLDTEPGVHAALEIFEFANSQLLEFRYYDALLDVELGRIYPRLQQRKRFVALAGRGYVQAARELHALFIDVNEVTDRTQNALKMIGDIFAARLFHLVAERLGLETWKASVDEKLKTLDDIYRFAVEQVAISRGHLLELTIILILVFELVLFFMGIMT